MVFEPGGLATGVGSLPFTGVKEAVDLIKRCFPDVPHWPQLPQRGKQENFVHQFLQPLLRTGLLTDDGSKIFFDTTQTDWADNLTSFYSIYLEYEAGDRDALNEFAFPKESAAGFYAFLEELEKGTGSAVLLKGQVVGPITAAFQVKDERGRFAYYDDQLRDLIVKTVAVHSAWQAAELGRFGLPALIFVDEPAISIYGQSSYITVTRDMIKDDLRSVFQAVRGVGGLTGVHCCDAIDWSILFEAGPEFVNFDAYNYFSSMLPFVSSLKDYLNQGGALAWGLVPTLNDQALVEDEESLLAILEGEWAELLKRGIPRDILIRRCLITPACGPGLLSQELAERIYHLTSKVSERLRSS